MNMTNVNVLVRPTDTIADVVNTLCATTGITDANEPFCFSAIMSRDKEQPNLRRLKINCIEPPETNPYSINSLVSHLLLQEEPPNCIRYAQPPLEQWLVIFNPLLMKMVSRVQDNYSNIFTTRDELVSTLYLAVLDLYNKGYYLHQTLIFKTFVNLLNEECRRRKGATIESFSTVITKDEDGHEITILDQLADTMFDDDEEDEEYWHDMFEKVKSRMLEDMSELTFERILIQLMSKTVDRKTSYILDKYRQIFAPNYVPRPNRNSKTKGGNK